jgi:hypothetical protein
VGSRIGRPVAAASFSQNCRASSHDTQEKVTLFFFSSRQLYRSPGFGLAGSSPGERR